MVSWKMPLSMQKNESLEMGFKNGFVTKLIKNTKIWKNDWGRWMKASWETWESDFLEKKWCNEGENASGRREWIVTMEEERRVKREKHKKKKRQMRMGAKNSPPPPSPFSD